MKSNKFPLHAILCVAAMSFASTISAATTDTIIRLNGPFVPFAMCMGQMKASAQVDTSIKIGFTGIGLQDMNKTLLQDFQKVPAVASGAFKIHSTMWWTNVTTPAIDTVWLDGILDEAKKLGMAIWMVSDGNDQTNASKTKAISMITIAARRCAAKGVKLVLYPHGGAVIASAEQALAIIDSLKIRGITNVRLSLHLCHELKAGNRDRLNQVVAKVFPYMDFVTVSGADSNTYSINNDNWASGIKPLGMGTLDVRKFLRVLDSADYTGPIELHTYNLKSPADTGYDRHLERSLAWWKLRVKPDTGGTVRAAAPNAKVPLVKSLPDGRLRLLGLAQDARVRLYGLDGREYPEIRPEAGVWEYPPNSSSARIVRVQDASARSEHSMVVF